MSALFETPRAPLLPSPPRSPRLSDREIVRHADDLQRERAQVGRASQFLSDPLQQGVMGRDRARRLTM